MPGLNETIGHLQHVRSKCEETIILAAQGVSEITDTVASIALSGMTGDGQLQETATFIETSLKGFETAYEASTVAKQKLDAIIMGLELTRL